MFPEARARCERILFVRLPPFIGFTRHHPREVAFPFTIAYTATMAQQKGWRVAVLDVWAEGLSLAQCRDRIRSESPHVLVFEANAATSPAVLTCARDAKDAGVPHVVVFGPVPTFTPETLIGPDLPVDVGLVGESEIAAIELFDAFRRGGPIYGIAGIVYWDDAKGGLVRTPSRPLINDLDTLPVIKYDLLDMRRYHMYSIPMPLFRPVRWGFVFASRGCPYACKHCSFDHRQTFGRQFRTVSPVRVVDEVELLTRKYGINAISFEDDCFTCDRNHVFAICDELERRRVRVHWVAETRIDLVDRELVRRMKRAGCVGFNFGIESGSDRILKALNKGYTRAQALEGIKLVGDEGMRLRIMFMFGNPGETVADVQESISLAMQAEAITVQAHLCTPYPGTALLEEAEENEYRPSDFSSFDRIVCNLSEIPDAELWALQKAFYHKYYFSWHYLKVFARHRLPYVLPSAHKEIPLILQALFYLVWPSRRPRERDMDRLCPEKAVPTGSDTKSPDIPR